MTDHQGSHGPIDVRTLMILALAVGIGAASAAWTHLGVPLAVSLASWTVLDRLIGR